MATARVCVVVEAPVERLWPPLADFGNWIRWLPLVEGVELEGDGPAVVGSIRRLGTADAPVIRERFVACDEDAHTLAYAIVGPSMFPVRRYVATVRMLELSDRAATVVEWSGDFDADAADEVAVRPRIENLYRAFIDALAAHANA